MAHPAVNKALIKQIVILRKMGYSYERIAEQLSIGTSTAKKYAPFGVAIHLPRNAADKAPFTDRQIEIAQQALAKIEKEKEEKRNGKK